MYGTQLQLENMTQHVKRFRIRRQDDSPSIVRSVSAGSQTIEWTSQHQSLSFDVPVDAGAAVLLSIRFLGLPEVGTQGRRSLGYNIVTAARRYASEARDNFLS